MSVTSIQKDDKKPQSLMTKLAALKEKAETNRCTVCEEMSKMDKETKNSLIEVLCSKVTIIDITEALISEGYSISRFALGQTRRKCITGLKECESFKGVSDHGK